MPFAPGLVRNGSDSGRQSVIALDLTVGGGRAGRNFPSAKGRRRKTCEELTPLAVSAPEILFPGRPAQMANATAGTESFDDGDETGHAWVGDPRD